MIKFLDGPAAGTVLQLRRAPLLLRVVITSQGNVDALDQLDDEPQKNETIHVYRKSKDLGSYHLCCRGRNRSASGWYQQAEYSLYDPQPKDHEARDTTRWRAWCQAQQATLTPET